MTCSHITTHAADAQARLASQFQNKPKLAALLAAHTAQYQALEDALFSLYAARALATATGVILDRIGAAVGCPRPPGELDDPYRALIVAQIIVNTSEGTPETIYALLRQLGAVAAGLRELGNYDVDIEYAGTLLVGDAGLVNALTRATPPVAFTVTEYSATPFGFDGDPDAYGFGDGELSRRVV